MRIVKPGKLGVGKAVERVALKPSVTTTREVWDDYSRAKSEKSAKRVFEKGRGNRMVPAQAEQKPVDADDTSREPLNDQGAAHHPRADFESLEERLGISFADRTLLSRALTHRSALGLKERADYERLEFLGDAVLDLSVAHLLSDLHPEAREGELSKMRAALVNTQALADIARKLELGPYIRLGRGEFSSGGAERPSILADVMEAVIGAVYRDSSYEVALALIERIFGTSLQEVTPFDPKTELQEALHAAGSEPPEYLLELVEGPEHAPTFVTVVTVDGEIAGRGRGTTKKAAQQEAAAQALTRMYWSAPAVSLVEDQDFLIESALLYERVVPPVLKSSSAAGAAAPAVA